jgi:hypothetical protein
MNPRTRNGPNFITFDFREWHKMPIAELEDRYLGGLGGEHAEVENDGTRCVIAAGIRSMRGKKPLAGPHYEKFLRSFSFTRLRAGEIDDYTITRLQRWAHRAGTRAIELGYALRRLSGSNAPRESEHDYD